jgi:hypothetical protein
MMNSGVIGKGKVVVIGSTATRVEINEVRGGGTRGIVLVALTCILCLFYTVLMVETHNSYGRRDATERL